MESLELVEGYIKAKENFPIKSKLVHVEKLSGGLANYVYRLGFEDKSTVILKYYPRFLSSDRTIEVSQNRYFVEKAALELLGDNEEIKNSLRVPKLIFSEDSAHILVMEDAGKHTKTLFEILKANTDAQKVNLDELICNLAKKIHHFSKFLTEKSGISASSHKSQFENKTAWDIKQTYYIPLFRSEAEKYELSEELAPHLAKAKEILKPPSDDEGVFVFGDLWPSNYYLIKKVFFSFFNFFLKIQCWLTWKNKHSG